MLNACYPLTFQHLCVIMKTQMRVDLVHIVLITEEENHESY